MKQKSAEEFPSTDSGRGRVHLGEDHRRHSVPSEKFVRCLWYDGRYFLKRRIRSVEGNTIRVLSPGFWNTGRGPDFLRGVFQINAGEITCGDVEIHRTRGDWKAHAHQSDPAFRAVQLHVFLFNDGKNGQCLNHSGKSITEVCLAKQIRKSAAKQLTRIDPALYPYRTNHQRGRCSSMLMQGGAGGILEFLRSAGAARLAEKAACIGTVAGRVGEEQALYRALLESLGYALNKKPFFALSERLPWRVRRRIATAHRAETRPGAVEAALMGVAGLLPGRPALAWDDESRRYWRSISKSWRRIQRGWRPKPLESSIWDGCGSRPANAAWRRIAAVSPLFARSARRGLEETFFPLGASENRMALGSRLRELLARSQDSYWDHRYLWGGKRLSRPVSLLGRRRTVKIIANVLLPFLHYRREGELALGLFWKLPAVDDNAVTRLMITRLFGNRTPAPRSWGMAAQQGLIHIYHTFCSNDKTGCLQCPLPERVSTSRSSVEPFSLSRGSRNGKGSERNEHQAITRRRT